MTFHVLTLFPEMLRESANHSILKRAAEAGHIRINCVNIRDFAVNKHGQVDDAPYGGGTGMVMMPRPICRAYDYAASTAPPDTRFIFFTPSGKIFNQQMAEDFAQEEALILLCGHYEGVDRRVIDLLRPEEVSLGDFVLTGGEPAALVLIDAVTRLQPGVLKQDAHINESFSRGTGRLLEAPQYTRPPVFSGLAVPEVLLSGNHAAIENWRTEESRKLTQSRRPDLL